MEGINGDNLVDIVSNEVLHQMILELQLAIQEQKKIIKELEETVQHLTNQHLTNQHLTNQQITNKLTNNLDSESDDKSPLNTEDEEEQEHESDTDRMIRKQILINRLRKQIHKRTAEEDMLCSIM